MKPTFSSLSLNYESPIITPISTNGNLHVINPLVPGEYTTALLKCLVLLPLGLSEVMSHQIQYSWKGIGR